MTIEDLKIIAPSTASLIKNWQYTERRHSWTEYALEFAHRLINDPTNASWIDYEYYDIMYMDIGICEKEVRDSLENEDNYTIFMSAVKKDT